jgi:hypothetical protein
VVELRGLEPLNEIVLSRVNIELGYAKRREPTSADLRIYRQVLTASTRYMGLWVEAEDLHRG